MRAEAIKCQSEGLTFNEAMDLIGLETFSEHQSFKGYWRSAKAVIFKEKIEAQFKQEMLDRYGEERP